MNTRHNRNIKSVLTHIKWVFRVTAALVIIGISKSLWALLSGEWPVQHNTPLHQQSVQSHLLTHSHRHSSPIITQKATAPSPISTPAVSPLSPPQCEKQVLSQTVCWGERQRGGSQNTTIQLFMASFSLCSVPTEFRPVFVGLNDIWCRGEQWTERRA